MPTRSRGGTARDPDRARDRRQALVNGDLTVSEEVERGFPEGAPDAAVFGV